jgi:hypothetical protein
VAWRRSPEGENLDVREALSRLTLDDLRPLADLVADKPPRKKAELVPFLSKALTNAAKIRALYDQLDPVSQLAVRVATHDPEGGLDREKFRAWFGSLPRFDTGDPNRGSWGLSYAERQAIKPTPLRLFFPRFDYLPSDLRRLLVAFVPQPERFSVPTVESPPATITLLRTVWQKRQKVSEEWEVPLRVRMTAAEAQANVRAVLRLIDAGKVRVTDKKKVPSEASRQAVAAVLAAGDFYAAVDASQSRYDPGFDLGVQSFAWPVLLQAGGLGEKSGDALKLTASGRKAMAAAPTDLLRRLWSDWLNTQAFDEFARIEAVKGQEQAHLSAAAGRRSVVVEALTACPVGRWFKIDDFFRLLRATGREFVVSHSPDELYIAEHYYGNLGYVDEHAWEQLQGRFVLAFLFEYVATLGLIDVVYAPPQRVRKDFQSRWGTDEFECLSRYDGLLFARINSFGAWCLGLAGEYRPEPITTAADLRVLANLDIVPAKPLSPVDQMTLERFAEPVSEGVWKLSASKLLDLIEQGGSLDELDQFLAARLIGELPQTVATFLADLRRKAGKLIDRGPARLIECADEHLAAELAADRRLKGKCVRAGDRFLVIRESDLAAVRKEVRRLGHVWPISGST